MRHFFSYFLLVFSSIPHDIHAISFYIDKSYDAYPEVGMAIQDVTQLLRLAGCEEADSYKKAQYVIKLSKEGDTIQQGTLYASTDVDKEYFLISSAELDQVWTVYITATSYKGLANGLYYLLQNKLGFRFYHPKEIYIPPLPFRYLDSFNTSVSPRFDKMGFHIHAMHPLELTEYLLDENMPNGKEEVKKYIDWLCRNGQNYFEFNLLSSIDLKTWTPYMKDIVDYAHSRGIICGADLSMHMIQQRAFQLYKKFPSSFRKKEAQISRNIDMLMQIPWDVWNVEMATTEFTHKNQEKLYLQQKFLYDKLSKYHVQLTSRKHVVQDENLISNNKSKKNNYTDMDSLYAIFIHTVMFYGLNDTATPVYRNKDFSHLRALLIENKAFRDTWYFPESAYWVTFDNSVPMFLTPYLQARMEDIIYCDSLDIDGHVTFSSGWEWNYWAVDWSIARWSWCEPTQQLHDTEYLSAAIGDTLLMDKVIAMTQLQQHYIKDMQLIKVMTAQTVTDEIGGKLNLEFHPRPEYSYKYILNEAREEDLEFLERKYIYVLDTFVKEYFSLRKNIDTTIMKGNLSKELLNSLDITALRAAHRYYTLRYIIRQRRDYIHDIRNDNSYLLDSAMAIRKEAIEIVNHQQYYYRYNREMLSSRRDSKTAYEFGYLFPVENLHFWEREEWQARNNKWRFWQKSIWDVLKIIGVKK